MESPTWAVPTAYSETQPVGVQYANQLYSAKTWAILDLRGDWVIFSLVDHLRTMWYNAGLMVY